MVNCAIKWCGKCSQRSSYTKDGITFHRFPNDDIEKIKIWIRATHRDNFFPTKTSVVCSRHFTPDCFEALKKNRRRLYSSSVPTLYIPTVTSNPASGQSSSSKTDIPPSEDDELNSDDDCDESDALSKCSGCKQKIRGCVLVCVQCADSKWCGACADLALHPQHYLIRVPPSRPQNEINEVLQLLRCRLSNKAASLQGNAEESESATLSKQKNEEVERIDEARDLAGEQKHDASPEDLGLEQTNTEEMMVVVKSEVEEVDPLIQSADIKPESLVVKIEVDTDCNESTDASHEEPGPPTATPSGLDPTQSNLSASAFFKNSQNPEDTGAKKSVKSQKVGRKRSAKDPGTYQVYTHSLKKKSTTNHPPS